MTGLGDVDRRIRARRIKERADQTQTFLDDAQSNLSELVGGRQVDVVKANAWIAAAQAQATLAAVVALTRIAESLESTEAS